MVKPPWNWTAIIKVDDVIYLLKCLPEWINPKLVGTKGQTDILKILAFKHNTPKACRLCLVFPDMSLPKIN